MLAATGAAIASLADAPARRGGVPRLPRRPEDNGVAPEPVATSSLARNLNVQNSAAPLPFEAEEGRLAALDALARKLRPAADSSQGGRNPVASLPLCGRDLRRHAAPAEAGCGRPLAIAEALNDAITDLVCTLRRGPRGALRYRRRSAPCFILISSTITATAGRADRGVRMAIEAFADEWNERCAI